MTVEEDIIELAIKSSKLNKTLTIVKDLITQINELYKFHPIDFGYLILNVQDDSFIINLAQGTRVLLCGNDHQEVINNLQLYISKLSVDTIYEHCNLSSSGVIKVSSPVLLNFPFTYDGTNILEGTDLFRAEKIFIEADAIHGHITSIKGANNLKPASTSLFNLHSPLIYKATKAQFDEYPLIS